MQTIFEFLKDNLSIIIGVAVLLVAIEIILRLVKKIFNKKVDKKNEVIDGP